MSGTLAEREVGLDRPPVPDHSALWTIPRDDRDLDREIAHQVFEKGPFYRTLLDQIARTRAKHVLEVGAGSTIDSFWLSARSPAVFHAIDRARTSGAFARRVGRRVGGSVHLHVGDAFATPFPDLSFDVVFHQGLLEHFEDPLPLLRENLRILRTGGVLVVDVPQRYSLYTLLKRRRMRRGDWPWGWEREYSAAEMRTLGEGLSMELVGLSSWGYDFYTSILRWPCEKLRRRLPLGHGLLFRASDLLFRRVVEPIWEMPWKAAERSLGPHFMMNVTGVYRRVP